MSSLVIAGPGGYVSATTPTTSIASRLRRRAQWALPMLGWNLSMLGLSWAEHSPVFAVMAAGTLAVAAIVVVSEPDDLDD
jgi:hypothetical protein